MRVARKPKIAPPKPLGTPLPADWRQHNGAWRIQAMLARIPDGEYATIYTRFERQARGRVSDDWMCEWKAFCHHMLMTTYGDRATAGDLFA
jgi:hypothetical protein